MNIDEELMTCCLLQSCGFDEIYKVFTATFDSEFLV